MTGDIYIDVALGCWLLGSIYVFFFWRDDEMNWLQHVAMSVLVPFMIGFLVAVPLIYIFSLVVYVLKFILALLTLIFA